MRNLGLVPVIVATMIASMTLATAQSSGTAPSDKGSTGWSGGSRDLPGQTGLDGKTQNKPSETTGQNSADPSVLAAHDAESAKTQPLMAEGLDLKGPPRQFPANKTPE
jgi:hypothetical protein